MNDTYTRPLPANSALIIIDTQNDFTLADAPARIPGTQEVVPAIKSVLELYRSGGRPIFHIVRLYKKDGSNVDACRRARIEQGASIVRPGTEGAEIVAALKPDIGVRLDAPTLLDGQPQRIGDREWILYKPRWSAFHGTSLNTLLERLGVDTLAVVGCNFPNCPRATIYDASNRDMHIVVVTDAMSGLYEQGIQELCYIGVEMMAVEDIAGWLASPA
jgi:nicotinamidase-related amidase